LIERRVSGPLIWVERSNTQGRSWTIDCEDRCLQITHSGRLKYERRRGLRFQNPEVQRTAEITVIDSRGQVSADLPLRKISLQRKPRFEIEILKPRILNRPQSSIWEEGDLNR
jgi:hypothetical protein